MTTRRVIVMMLWSIKRGMGSLASPEYAVWLAFLQA